jgi:formate hydrogenlyase subunit 6/NADH:ubiquinone oxidoreductase subunit I
VNVVTIKPSTVKEAVMAYKISDACVACGACKEVCPVEAISEGDIYTINPDICIDCGACASECPSEAISPA